MTNLKKVVTVLNSLFIPPFKGSIKKMNSFIQVVVIAIDRPYKNIILNLYFS